MRGICLLTVLLLAGAAWADERPRGECHRLTQQIARYERDADWARQRGNALWEAASERQVARLEHRLQARCPELVPPTLGERVGAALDLAGRGALKVLPFLY